MKTRDGRSLLAAASVAMAFSAVCFYFFFPPLTLLVQHIPTHSKEIGWLRSGDRPRRRTKKYGFNITGRHSRAPRLLPTTTREMKRIMHDWYLWLAHFQHSTYTGAFIYIFSFEREKKENVTGDPTLPESLHLLFFYLFFGCLLAQLQYICDCCVCFFSPLLKQPPMLDFRFALTIWRRTGTAMRRSRNNLRHAETEEKSVYVFLVVIFLCTGSVPCAQSKPEQRNGFLFSVLLLLEISNFFPPTFTTFYIRHVNDELVYLYA